MFQDYLKCIQMSEEGYSQKEIAAHLDASPGTVRNVLNFAWKNNLNSTLAEELGNEKLALLHHPSLLQPPRMFAQPDFGSVHKNLGKKENTLHSEWEDYLVSVPQGQMRYGYSRFCQLYKAYTLTKGLIMRHTHKPGDAMEVDWAGTKVSIVNKDTGETSEGPVFVAVLPYSLYFYCEVCSDMQLPTWIECHNHAFSFFGGVPRLVKSDNLKTGVTTNKRLHIDLNKTYQEMSDHYDTAIVPCKPRKPKWKPHAEGTVKIVTQTLLKELGRKTFHSIAEAQAAMKEAQDRLLNRPVSVLQCSRAEYYEKEERSYMKKLPPKPYELAIWEEQPVRRDYLIQVDKNKYSVPYTLVGERVSVKITASAINVFCKGRLEAKHKRLTTPQRFPIVLEEHMPRNHREYLHYSKDEFLAYAESVGPETKRVFESLLKDAKEPEQVYPFFASLKKLGNTHGGPALEAACAATGTKPDLDLIDLYVKQPEKLPAATAQTSPVADPHPAGNGITRGMEQYSRTQGNECDTSA